MKRLAVVLVLALAPVPAALAQSVIYDNTTTSLNNDFPLLPEWRNDSAEAGDEIWVAGAAREVVELKLLFFYRGTIPGTIDLQIRFRPYDEPSQAPGDPFYDSGKILGMPTFAGANEYTFAIPHVVVPDRFIWTVQAYNRQGSVGEIGISYYDPPTIGSSEDFFWLSDMGSTWNPYSWGADPVANFAARVTAVPEPASLCAFGLGLLLLKRRSVNR